METLASYNIIEPVKNLASSNVTAPRSGRVLKPKKFGDTSAATLGSPKPDPTTTEGEQPPAKKQARSSLRGGKKEEEAVKEEEVKADQPAEPRKMWVKVMHIREKSRKIVIGFLSR